MKQNVLLDKTFAFACEIIRLCRQIRLKEKEFMLTRQLLKAATSIGANAEEAVAAHSSADFIAKLTISQKEARETRYWLRLITTSGVYDCSKHLNSIYEINKLIAAIIITTKKRNI